MPPGCIPTKTLHVSRPPLFPTPWCPDLSPWSPPVTMTQGVPSLFLVVLPPCPTGSSLLPPQFTLPPEVRPQYLPVALGLVVALPTVGVSCKGLPTGLRFGPVIHWWGDIGYPWILGTTSEFYSMPLSTDPSTLMPRYPPPLFSPCISCPPSRRLETFASASCVIPG